jgi:RimJ/RimL family protein N-acetyltransferase
MPTIIEIPELRTTRLRLRGFRASDLDAFAAMQANAEVMRYIGAGGARTREQTWRAMAEQIGQWGLRGYGMFALEDAMGRFVGRAGILHPPEWPEPEIAYSLDRPFWGIGLATESVMKIRDWAFASFGFPRLASFISPDNIASIKVAKSVGAVFESTTDIAGGPAQHWVHYPPGSGPVA